MNETFFSTVDFVEAWSRAFGNSYRPLAIPIIGSGSSRTMYAVQTLDNRGRRFVLLAPFGLYASPGWDGQLEQSTIKGILKRLTGIRTTGFVWNVRFDQEVLAKKLASLGFKFKHTSTHILPLEQNYEHVFANYNATIRNEVRKAHRRKVVVRDAVNQEDVKAYYQVHTRLFQQKGISQCAYPVELFFELIKIHNRARLLIAEFEGKVIGGGLFFRDGCSVMYWHGASDRDYSHLFASRAVIDKAICWACESGAKFFNFGGSAGISSIARFKSAWGASPEMNWMFEWNNPFWESMSSLKRSILKKDA